MLHSNGAGMSKMRFLLHGVVLFVAALSFVGCDQGKSLTPPPEHWKCFAWEAGELNPINCDDAIEGRCDSVEFHIPLPQEVSESTELALISYGDLSFSLRTNTDTLAANDGQAFRSPQPSGSHEVYPIYSYWNRQAHFFDSKETEIIQASDTLIARCKCSSIYNEDRMHVKLADPASAVKLGGRFAKRKPITSASLPQLEVSTENSRLWTEKKSGAWYSVTHPDLRVEEGFLQLRIRGFTSLCFAKKNFSVRLEDASNFGFEKLKPREKWVFHGPFGDRSMVRNSFTFALAKNLKVQSPQTSPFELGMNRQFCGLYHLISSPSQPEGDDELAVFELDRPKEKNFQLPSTIGANTYNLKFCHPEQDTALLMHAITQFEERLISGEPLHPAVQAEFIDYLIINELAKNVDAFSFSTYFKLVAREDTSLIVPGSLWDYNIAWGNSSIKDGHLTAGWVVELPGNERSIWQVIWQQEGFRDAAAKRYHELRNEVLDDAGVLEILEKSCSEIAPGLKDNDRRFPIFTGNELWPNHQIVNSYDEELQLMKEWIQERLNWLDREFEHAMD